MPPPGLTFPSRALRTPYTFQYNLTVQRQVLRDTVLEVAYVGKLGRRLLMDILTNPALYAPGATVANIDSRRIYKGFGSLNQMGTRSLRLTAIGDCSSLSSLFFRHG